MLTKLAGLSLLAKGSLGIGVATAAVTTAGAAGVLPDAAQHAVATVVSSVSPLELPDPLADLPGKASVDLDVKLPGVSDDAVDDNGDDDADDDAGEDGDAAERRDNHGACVSTAAKDASVSGRDHGKAVSEIARSDCGKTADGTSTSSTSSTSTSTSSTTSTTALSGSNLPGSNRGSGGGGGNSGSGNAGGGNQGNGTGNSGSGGPAGSNGRSGS